MARLYLTPGRHRRLRAGHPWIYRGEIGRVSDDARPGEAVEVVDATGRRLGRGFFNPAASLACRLLTWEDEPLDAGLFRRRLEAALAYRRRLGLTGDAYRLCWSEADGLPGLIVDRYGSVSVLQCLTLGMVRAVAWTVEALAGLFPDDPIFRLDDAGAARLEGFEPEHRWLAPPADGVSDALTLEVQEGPCRFGVTIGAGQKTGLYLDQRENRLAVAGLAAGRRMLDAFCYAGAFACQALRAGAASALLLESSEAALAAARQNLARNGVEGQAQCRAGNAFDVLRELEGAGARFDLVVLDPPPFTRRKEALEAAARGYKEINLRGLRLLEPGGVLATFSCSHHVTPALFEAICREAAGDAGVSVRVRATLGQSPDHPVLLAVPETRYLTGLLLEVGSARRGSR